MVAVIVPWRGGCPHRARAWEFVRERLESLGSDVQVIEAVAPSGDWCKAAAVSPAAAALPPDTEVLVVHDADVWCDTLPQAVQAVRDGAPWAIPHRGVFRLTEAATEAVYAGGQGDELDQRPYSGTVGGGIVVTTPAVYRDCPLDPRFVGWGQEDESWGMALLALHGPPVRFDGPLTHLWHPPQPRDTRRHGSPAGRALARRYARARRDPVLMRALLEEATACSAAA